MTWNLTNDVKNIVSEQTTNYGWAIEDETFWYGYNIPIAYFLTKEAASNKPYLEITFNGFLPPSAPEINGPSTGQKGKALTYTFIASDPGNRNLTYTIDWGDGQTEQVGPVASDTLINRSHTWQSTGQFSIRSRATATGGATGDWGYFNVKMPYSYQPPTFPLLERLFNRFPNAFPYLRTLLRY